MKPHSFIEDKAWPEGLKDKKVIAILKEYMNLSNASNPAHPEEPPEEAFAHLFTEDGVYELASHSAKGHKGRHPVFNAGVLLYKTSKAFDLHQVGRRLQIYRSYLELSATLGFPGVFPCFGRNKRTA